MEIRRFLGNGLIFLKEKRVDNCSLLVKILAYWKHLGLCKVTKHLFPPLILPGQKSECEIYGTPFRRTEKKFGKSRKEKKTR